MPESMSVVIPALNEEAVVEAAVRSVRDDAEEVVVVDGGSGDRTREVAAAAGARVLRAPRGRGRQLDLGARQCGGEWIVFLHADTRLEEGWAAALCALPPRVVGGAFRFALDSARPAYRLLERAVALRCRLFGLPFGDQGIFARRRTCDEVGGIPHLPIMEDVAFVRRLRGCGALVFPPVRALTSPRRWEGQGLAATTLKNWALLARYAMGASPEQLARAYDGHSLARAWPAEPGGRPLSSHGP